MNQCKDIEKHLPLYDEGALSGAEKQSVEEHLAQCAACRRELAYLRKSSQLVEHLADVEEPPWFQQQIMAGVRKEADKKGIVQKWFYPLRIKIPVPIMATIVIAVLAFYLYRSGNEQMRQILPQAPKEAAEMQKEQTPARSSQASDETAPVRIRKKAEVSETGKQDRQSGKEPEKGGAAPKAKMQDIAPEMTYGADRYLPKDAAETESKAPSVDQAPQNEMPAVRAQIAGAEKKTEKQAFTGLAKTKRDDKMAAPAAPGSMAASIALPTRADVLLQVVDINAAAAEVEKVLEKYDAQKVTKQWAGGSLRIQARIEGRLWKNVIVELKGIGAIKEKVAPVDAGESGVTLTIEISAR